DDDCGAIVEKWSSFYAAADDMHDPADCPVPADKLIRRRGIEVGHIFYFGSKYSEPMGGRVADADGNLIPVEMGSYGIGISRLVAAVIEASHDDNGIIWPDSVAPYDVGIVDLKPDDEACAKAVSSLQSELDAAGKSFIHDERSERPGAKFADMDLIGLPWQIVVGPRGLANGSVELKRRATGDKIDIPLDQVVSHITG
ncbi:MAG: His/Gly/Thr/Pro-type tRNA ligase C-terminal domain-containing protein, partial [Pseudomonadota bacterium]